MIRDATPADEAAIRALLVAAQLPVDGAFDATCQLWVLDLGGVRGAVGVETHAGEALLRSLVVDPQRSGKGDGRRLLEHAVQERRRQIAPGQGPLYALTTTIGTWLLREGWIEIQRNEMPKALDASPELQGACPDSARAFRLLL